MACQHHHHLIFCRGKFVNHMQVSDLSSLPQIISALRECGLKCTFYVGDLNDGYYVFSVAKLFILL